MIVEMRIDTVMESLFLIDWAGKNYNSDNDLQDRYGRPISTRDMLRKYAPLFRGENKILHVNSANKRLKYLLAKRLIKNSHKTHWGEKAAVNVYELSELGKSYFENHYQGFYGAFAGSVKKFQ